MKTEPITFEQLPQAMGTLLAEIRELRNNLILITKPSIEKDRWLNISELQEYLPDHPAKATIYGWIHHRLIPYHKTGKRLRFLQQEIDEYLQEGKRKTMVELQYEAQKKHK